MSERWLAFDIGCLECGESSAVIGVYGSQSEAQSACDAAEEKQAEDWRGQHSFEVFSIEVPA